MGSDVKARWAWCSPLPPAGSGIADYNAELLEGLRRLDVDIEVFDMSLKSMGVLGRVELEREPPSTTALPVRMERGDFDLAVYHLGNHPGYHAAILQAALAPNSRHHGVAVLHEPMLHHLLREPLLGRGQDRAYLDLMEQVYGEVGRHAAERFLQADGLPEMWAFGLFEPVVDACRGVIVFNEPARQRVLASRPEAHVEVVPQHVVIEPDLLELASRALSGPSSAALRQPFGLPEDAFVFGCFGHLTLQKRLHAIVRAFGRLLALEAGDRLPLRLLLAGQLASNVSVESLLEEVPETQREAVRANLVVTGRLPMDDFQRAMAACDVALNLRFPSGGETSATLLRLLALGKPTLVTDVGSFAGLPSDVVLRVPPDDCEDDLLLACMRRLVEDTQLCRDLGTTARRFAVAEHSLETSVQAWQQALTRIAEAPVPAPITAVVDSIQRTVQRTGPVDPYLQLHLDLGMRIDELGLGSDEALLRAVARATVELGLDRGFSP